MKAYVFPGQGAQYPGMGKDLAERFQVAEKMFVTSDKILGFGLTNLMFKGTDDDLRQTRVTQPAIFVHSVVLATVLGERFRPDMVAGHSLGEFSALVAAGALSFEDGLRLVSARATAMQKACDAALSTMAAVLGLDDQIVEDVCREVDDVVVPANYNSPGQIVISGSVNGIDTAVKKLQELGAKRAIKLSVGGAFHSPLMEPARSELATAIEKTSFSRPRCPIYQNVNAISVTDPEEIRKNLVDQLTSPVRWTQTVLNMINDGAVHFTEVGPGNVLQGLVKKADRQMGTSSAADLIS